VLAVVLAATDADDAISARDVPSESLLTSTPIPVHHSSLLGINNRSISLPESELIKRRHNSDNGISIVVFSYV